MSTQIIAYATTTASMPDLPPGLMLQQIETDENVPTDYTDLEYTIEADGWGQAESGAFDEDALDCGLEALGYRRTEQWYTAFGQAMTVVERT